MIRLSFVWKNILNFPESAQDIKVIKVPSMFTCI